METPSPGPITDGPTFTKLVYRKDTGKILHVHDVLAMPDAIVPASDEIETDARTLAEEITNTPRAQCDVVTVEHDELRPDTSYMVDPSTRQIVERGPSPDPSEFGGDDMQLGH